MIIECIHGIPVCSLIKVILVVNASCKAQICVRML